jgi:WD40 repeat protein
VIEKSNGTGHLLVVADQFEELFTLTPEPNRRPFAQALLGALGKARFTLLVTLRADFYSQIITLHRELSDRLAPAQVNIGALTRDELRESITCPAKLVGLDFQQGLVDRILDDVGSEPGNLPLLEFALTGLFSRREDRTLTFDAYNEIGGVTGALAKRAEAEFARFTPEEQTAARRLFSRLVRVARPQEGVDDTRQQVEIQAIDAPMEKVAQALAGRDVRLLVMGRSEIGGRAGGQTVELAHEALIRSWDRLRGWIGEDREFLLWRQRLEVQMSEWQDDKRDAGYLLRGAPLSEAERWLLDRQQDLTRTEFDLIRKSIELKQAELLVAQAQRLKEYHAELICTRAVLAAESIMRAGMFTNDEIVREALELLPRCVARLFHRSPVEAVAFSQDGRRVATGTFDGVARVWEVTSGSEIALVEHRGPVSAVAFSPDGERVASSSYDGTARVWEAANGKELARIKHASAVLALAFSADGQRVVSGDIEGTVRVWKAASGEQLARVDHGKKVRAVTFSPDGDQIVSGSDDSTARIWDVATGKEVARLEHNSPVSAVAFSADGSMLVSGSWDDTARVWKLPQKPRSRLPGVLFRLSKKRKMAAGVMELARVEHGGFVSAVAFSRGADLVVSGSSDCTARVWEAAGGKEIRRVKHGGGVTAVAFYCDRIVSACNDGTARVWEARSGKELARVEHDSWVRAVAFSGDGKTVVSGSWDHTARVWETFCEIGLTRVHCDVGWAAAFSSDIQRVVSGTDDNSAGVWEVATGKQVARVNHDAAVRAVALSSDGGRVVTGSGDGTAKVWEVASGRELARVEHEAAVCAVAVRSKILEHAETMGDLPTRYERPWQDVTRQFWTRVTLCYISIPGGSLDNRSARNHDWIQTDRVR